MCTARLSTVMFSWLPLGVSISGDGSYTMGPGIPTPGLTHPRDWVLLLLLPNVMEHRSLLLVCFYFYQNLQVVPHGTKGTSPESVTRPVYFRSQLRNNTNTVSTLVLLIHLLHVLCTWYAGIAHHRVLQTSGRGWADSKAVHGMECSGVRSLYWRSLSAGAAA